MRESERDQCAGCAHDETLSQTALFVVHSMEAIKTISLSFMIMDASHADLYILAKFAVQTAHDSEAQTHGPKGQQDAHKLCKVQTGNYKGNKKQAQRQPKNQKRGEDPDRWSDFQAHQIAFFKRKLCLHVKHGRFSLFKTKAPHGTASTTAAALDFHFGVRARNLDHFADIFRGVVIKSAHMLSLTRSMMLLVDSPGRKGRLFTSPPRASTISAPTI